MDDIFEKKTISAICVSLCTDEFKYIEDDSHYLHIPKTLFINYTNNLTLNNMCFEISNPTNPIGPKLYFKKIEPAIREFDTNILLPDWVCKKLCIQMYGDQINIIPINKPNQIKRCKIRGNESSYIKMDIKTLLEDKINQFKCLNINTVFTINKIKFTIIELISIDNNPINYGITTDELEIDFDTPDDIKLIERRKILTEKITKKIEDKINSNNDFKNKFNAKQTGIFKLNDYIESKQNQLKQFNPNIDWDCIHQIIIFDLEKDYANNSFELEENKKILQVIIDEVKNIIDEFSNINSDINSNEKIESNIFNTKGYKLNDDKILYEQNLVKLTKEEIRKARLEKFIKE